MRPHPACDSKVSVSLSSKYFIKLFSELSIACLQGVVSKERADVDRISPSSSSSKGCVCPHSVDVFL